MTERYQYLKALVMTGQAADWEKEELFELIERKVAGYEAQQKVDGEIITDQGRKLVEQDEEIRRLKGGLQFCNVAMAPGKEGTT